MFQENDVVRLKKSIHDIPAGARGTVMLAESGKLVLVEFIGGRIEESRLVEVDEGDLVLEDESTT